MSMSDIVKFGEVSKILVTANANFNYLAFKLGRRDIYIYNVKTLETDPNKNALALPMLVETRSKRTVDTQLFVVEEKQFKAYKIFKHGNGFLKDKDVVGLAANTMKNVLNMFNSPKTFYIDSDSKDLRDIFYNIGVRINEEDQTGHNFDFEIYDYRLIIKKYNIINHYYDFCDFSVFTCLTGKEMPNYWKQD
jgi:hypothetical protein